MTGSVEQSDIVMRFGAATDTSLLAENDAVHH
jgi:hypothetical protein